MSEELPDTHGRTKAEFLRWTIGRAATEFGAQHKAISQGLVANGAKQDELGRYSTREIAAAIYGDRYKAEMRKMELELRTAERKDLEATQRLIPIETAARMFRNAGVAIRQRILTSGLTQDEKMEILSYCEQLEDGTLLKT